MKKLLSIIIFSIILFNNTYAHPLDISISTWDIKWNKFSITTYFHTFEIEYLLKNNWINPKWVNNYFENQNIIKNYISENILLKNNWKYCEIKDIELLEDDTYLIVSNWLWVSYRFECDDEIKTFNLINKSFIEFSLQTNRITLYDLNNWIKNLKPIYYKVLTSKINEFELDINNLSNDRIDSDNDWLSDEEEKIYYTDINNIDTDWDNYTDKEEIDYWWNPINPELWPWQKFREFLDIDLSNKNIDNLEKIQKEISRHNISDYWYWWKYLEKSLKYINDFYDKSEWSVIIMFFIVFLLWMIHAIWPGHSKSILIWYTLEKWNWYIKWSIFALIFTITHILDIIILLLITNLLFNFIDISKYLYYIQIIWTIVLIILSSYILINAKKSLKWNNEKECKKVDNKKNGILIAFFAWLAPCSFAWSIYLLLVALWKINMILLFIFALWLWILTTLLIIVFISVFLKNKIYSKVSVLSSYSKIISSSIILITSIIIAISLIIK